jgi:phosphatidylglycerol:prolipoprotein diacylglycerol transferase
LPYMDQVEAGKFGDPAVLDLSELPPRSLPVHPTQLYSAIDAGLLCWFLWSYYPYRRRDGEVAALMLTLHPISRFLLEVIRVDESAVFGTGFSISQNISILFFVLTLFGWFWLLRQPARTTSFPLAA